MNIEDLRLTRARQIAETVPDPELPMIDIGELGMIRDVRLDGGQIVVVFTPTYSGCPATEPIQRDILSALEAEGLSARIEIQRTPAWTTEWIRPSGLNKLRSSGIAPPTSSSALPIFAERQVACPRCRSLDTERIAEHGSTPCKALYRCLSCREPFDHFKCH